MVYRSLPYFASAYHTARATDVVSFLASHAERYGILKRQRNRDKPSLFRSLTERTKALLFCHAVGSSNGLWGGFLAFVVSAKIMNVLPRQVYIVPNGTLIGV